ncbi:MAG: redoxin domain-containing protein [Chloroflexota bacterium]|nr:redoxin domain-containing protein [Chloroflexota bacterium]
MNRNRWLTLTGIILLFGLAALIWGRVPAEGIDAALPPAPAVNHPAPAFTLNTLDGEQLELADLQGQPVVLNFWATWCGPCRAEMPELQRLHEQLSRAGVVVLGVNQNETPDIVSRYREGLGIDFPTVIDQRLRVSREYAVNSIPTTFFIDRDGVIQRTFIGPMTDAVLAQNLKAIYP